MSCNCDDKDNEETVEPSMMDRVRSFFGFSTPEPVEETASAETKSVARNPNQLTAAQTITDLADWYNYPQREQFLFNSEMNESMSGSSNSVDHINPVEVQGSEDIMGAEELIWPQFTQNISGQGRTFANTIHPGMVIPNPDNYPTPAANNPWTPFVDIQTYGDIKNVPLQPYPSAMGWATNPDNYQEYPSQ
tara:strand:+ start:31013 stop:31585 length:573 start_codon:yes stop_codon:yes gene_type:complete